MTTGLGHLGQRGQQRPRQHRRRRQPGAWQPRPARPVHPRSRCSASPCAATAARARHPSRSRRIPCILESPTIPRADMVAVIPLQRQRQRQHRHLRVPGLLRQRRVRPTMGPCTSPQSTKSSSPPLIPRADPIVSHLRGAGGRRFRQRRPVAGDPYLGRRCATAGRAARTTIDSGPDLTTVQTDATFVFSASERGGTRPSSARSDRGAAPTAPRRRPTRAWRSAARVPGPRDRRRGTDRHGGTTRGRSARACARRGRAAARSSCRARWCRTT